MDAQYTREQVFVITYINSYHQERLSIFVDNLLIKFDFVDLLNILSCDNSRAHKENRLSVFLLGRLLTASSVCLGSSWGLRRKFQSLLSYLL